MQFYLFIFKTNKRTYSVQGTSLVPQHWLDFARDYLFRTRNLVTDLCPHGLSIDLVS